MKHIWPKLQRLLYPGWKWVTALALLSGVLLYLTFGRGLENTAFAYAAYVLSAYALTVVCLCLTKSLRGGFRTFLHRNRYVHSYLTDIPFKTHVSLCASLCLNLLFAAVKLFCGIHFRSVWFGALAAYYIILSLLRFLLLHSVYRNGLGAQPVAEYRRCRLCGLILLLMNIVLSGVVILVVDSGAGFSYPGYLIYVVAMYAFYNIVTAVRDVVRYRKYSSPVMSAAKAVKLATALVSMLALETAMLTQFNTERGPEFERVMTAVTGGCVCALVLFTAVAMIVKSVRSLKALRGDARP